MVELGLGTDIMECEEVWTRIKGWRTTSLRRRNRIQTLTHFASNKASKSQKSRTYAREPSGKNARQRHIQQMRVTREIGCGEVKGDRREKREKRKRGEIGGK